VHQDLHAQRSGGFETTASPWWSRWLQGASRPNLGC
jgi:hypothetical protein